MSEGFEFCHLAILSSRGFKGHGYKQELLSLLDMVTHQCSRALASYVNLHWFSLYLHFFQKLISKNFSEEIRAAKDVETFLERPTLLLGLQETSLQGIIDKMLEKLISVIGGDDIDFEEARMAFFTHDSGKANLEK